MDYQTAKALKDAGFPQPYGNRVDGSERIFYFENGKYVLPFSVIKDICYENGFVIDYARELVYIPTLEELIEMCVSEERDGTDFQLSYEIGIHDVGRVAHWRARKRLSEQLCDTFGNTPKEAVANLYLALHGNKESTGEEK